MHSPRGEPNHRLILYICATLDPITVGVLCDLVTSMSRPDWLLVKTGVIRLMAR